MEWKARPDSTVSEALSLCFQTAAATGAVVAVGCYSSVSAMLALVLATFFCDTAVEAFAERLFLPIWQRVRRCRPAVEALNSAHLDPTSTHRLCTLPQNKRHSYATPNVRITRSRAPPLAR